SGQPRNCNLGANITVALLQKSARGLFDLLKVRSAGVAIGIDRLPALTAQELIDRKTGTLAEDVPQSHVDAAERIAEYRAVAPVGADKRGLPDILDPQRILAQYEGFQVAVDGRLDHTGALGKGCAAQAE